MNHNWIHTGAHATLPPNAVFAGSDSDGSPIYIGRAHHEGDLLVAKVLPTKQASYVCHNGLEIPKYQYEVLVGNGFSWVASGNGHVPPNAVRAGNTSNGQPLFVGRTHHAGSLTPGKIHTAHGCLYFPYGGAEQSSLQYEVLISQPSSRWDNCSSHSGVPPDAVIGGHDTDGSQIYVGRAFHEGDQIPAKVIPSKHVAYVGYNGQEIPKHHFEVFCLSNPNWIPSSHGAIPPGAVVGGRTSNGETLYVGRTFYQGSLTPGKIHPSHGSLYISYGGAEIPFKNYDVLVEQ